MAHYLNMAIDKYNGVSTDLCEAECVVLGMYTADDDANAFYKELNAATRKQQYIPYHVFSSVLLSAVTKLASTSPLKPGTTVFRGLGSPVHVPTEVPKSVYFDSFLSTSTSLDLAKNKFADGGLLMTITLNDTSGAAQLPGLSLFKEEEVLIHPFMAFDVIKFSSTEMELVTSKNQVFTSG